MMCIHTCEMNVFFVGVFALIQKPIETFYENCLSFMFACLHLIQYWCWVCRMPFHVSFRLVSSCLVPPFIYYFITLANKSLVDSWEPFSFIVSIVFDSINLMRFALFFLLLLSSSSFSLFSQLSFSLLFVFVDKGSTHTPLTTFQSHFQAELFMLKLFELSSFMLSWFHIQVIRTLYMNIVPFIYADTHRETQIKMFEYSLYEWENRFCIHIILGS